MPPNPSLFLERLITFLIPYFLPITSDLDAARAEILEILASYGARTRAEMISAMQIIAFSFTTLDVLAEAKATEMSLSMRLRYRGCANGLNRSTQHNEGSLAKRQASGPLEVAAPMPEPARTPEPAPTLEPANDVADADVQDALLQARAQIESYRACLAVANPASRRPAPAEDLNMAALNGVIIDTLAHTSAPIARTPIHPPSSG